MILPTLQYITNPNEDFENLSWLHRLGENGVKWVQFRFKENHCNARFPDKHYKATFIEIAEKLKVICDHFEIILTLNDNVEALTFVEASGVHVGMEDEDPGIIRCKIGDSKILGATANSIKEIMNYSSDAVNYFGVGPLRHTNTKDSLKPFLGINGYKKLMQELESEGIFKPIIAIGGIVETDVPELLSIGIHGIAVSGLLFDAKHSVAKIKELVALTRH